MRSLNVCSSSNCSAAMSQSELYIGIPGFSCSRSRRRGEGRDRITPRYRLCRRPNILMRSLGPSIFAEGNSTTEPAYGIIDSLVKALATEEQSFMKEEENKAKIKSAKNPDGNDGIEERASPAARINVVELAGKIKSAKNSDDVEVVMKEKGELPLQLYSSLIRGLGREHIEAAMAVVEWLKRKKKDCGFHGPNLFIYNSLLGAVKQSRRFQEVEKIMNDMSMVGIKPNVVTYNTLMGIYIEEGRERRALEVLEEMEKKGICPSPASVSTAFLAYRGLEDGFGAVRFFSETKSRYERHEIVTSGDEDWEVEYRKMVDFTARICYQVMRRWLVKEGNQTVDVLKLLTEMDKVGLQTCRADQERLVWACTREEHITVAKELYSRIREKDGEISLSVCNHVIWLMGKAKKWWAALEIYEELLDRGPNPNNMSYELIVSHFNILLTAARKRGIWRWGMRLLNKMEEKGLKPGSREWNAVLVACSKASETSAAVEIFGKMVEQGEKPTVVSYGALLSALGKGGLYEEAHRVWDHMIKLGVPPNLYAYTIMSSVHAAQGQFDSVRSIINDMMAAKVEPTVVTYNAIITACARNDGGASAYEWFQELKAQSITPNEVTYEMLIQALAKDGKPRMVYELYLRGYNEGHKLSFRAYDTVVACAEEFAVTMDLSALGPRPPETKKKVRTRDSREVGSLADVLDKSGALEAGEISGLPSAHQAL